MATIACVVFFVVAIMAVSGTLTWLVPQLPEIVQKDDGMVRAGVLRGILVYAVAGPALSAPKAMRGLLSRSPAHALKS
ncbi:MAG: hypothetical protein AAF968_13885 [Pseudomonadota bacterium]